MGVSALLKGTALGENGARTNRRILSALTNDDPEQLRIVVDALCAEKAPAEHMRQILAGEAALTFEEMAHILRELHNNGLKSNPAKAKAAEQDNSIFTQAGFYESLRENFEDAQALREQIRVLREEGKTQSGFLKTNFNIFAHHQPLEKITENVLSFDKYCRKNGITFDEAAQQLVPGNRPKTAFDKIHEFRFLIAAAGGMVIGLAGLSAISFVPALGAIPTAFFAALPYIAVPFISLNIFKAFSEKSIMQEAGTFARFGATMMVGFLVSLGVTTLMGGMLDPVAVASGFVSDAATHAGGHGAAGFSPAQYILHGIGLFAGLATLFKRAKATMQPEFEKEQAKKTGLSGLYNKAAGIFVNKRTAPCIVSAGHKLEKLADMADKGFGGYMNWLGIPAIFLMMSNTMATNGLAQLSSFGAYYAITAVSMATAALTISAASYFYGCRKKEFKAMAKTVGTAFSISSSMATMPVTKESLKEMGVSESTRNAVTPLGANFNMMGTSLYLGTTANCATIMFGYDLTLMAKISVMTTTLLTAFGTPGAPASSIALLDPVLQKAGLTPAHAQKMYEAVLIIDRLADMAQTALNVWGDMLVAVSKDWPRLRINRVKNIKRIRAEREKKALAAA